MVPGSDLHEPLIETFFFPNRLIPRLLPEFVRLEKMAAVELFYTLAEQWIGHELRA